eukprot:jgi/Mesvir1/11659/Mv00056-RA.2
MTTDSAKRENEKHGIVDRFIDACRVYKVPPDPSIVITFRLRLPLLRPTSPAGFTLSTLLAVADAVRAHPGQACHFVTEINLKGCSLGYAGASLLVELVKHFPNLQLLDVSQTALGCKGAACLGEIISREASRLRTISARSNSVEDRGALLLAPAVRRCSPQLAYLDLCNNRLTHVSVHALQDAAAAIIRARKATEIAEGRSTPRSPDALSSLSGGLLVAPSHLGELDDGESLNGSVSVCYRHRQAESLEVHTEGNYVLVEIMNSISHGIGLCGGIVGSALLLRRARGHHTNMHVAAAAVYCASLCLLFLSSTLFHSFFRLGVTKLIFRNLDHSAIYGLIAGTYTPILLLKVLPLRPTLATVVTAVQWSIAVVGILLSVLGDKKHRLYKPVMLTLFLAMGWGAFVAAPSIVHTFEAGALYLIASGGVVYTLGVPFFIRGNRFPAYHAVW